MNTRVRTSCVVVLNMNGVEQHPQYWYTLSCYHSVNGYYTQLYHMTTDTQGVGQDNMHHKAPHDYYTKYS